MKEISPHLVPDGNAESWISSVPPSGAFVGSLVAGPLMQLLGRRRTLMISSPLWVLGWILIATSQSYEMIICARILTGFCVGLVTPSAAVYVMNVSFAEIRGILGSLPALFMAGGILVSYLLGAWLPWNQLAWAISSIPSSSHLQRKKETSGFSREELLRRPVYHTICSLFYALDFPAILATILVGLIQLIANSSRYLSGLGKGEGLGLLPLISLMAFMVGFSIGYCSIPFLLMGELIPEKQRSFLSSICW
ncbi:hypothetical protein L9F63_026207, partial [Diploptera punctata]